MKQNNNILKYFVILFCLQCVYLRPLNAYDRKGAEDYARLWWNARNYPSFYDYEDPDRNPYNEAQFDCTNFASQCLFAGNIRFKNVSGYEQGDNRILIDSKRCIIRARELPFSLSSYHAAYSNIIDSQSIIPSNLEVGDIISLWIPRSPPSYYTPQNIYYFHTLEIVQSGDSLNNIIVTCHTNDNITTLSSYIGNYYDANKNGILEDDERIKGTHFHLPDSPIIKELTLKLDANEKYSAYQDPDRYSYNPVIDNSTFVSSGNLTVKIEFDTTMNTAFTPVVKFGKSEPYEIYSFTGGSWSQTEDRFPIETLGNDNKGYRPPVKAQKHLI